jgi:diguanylate cyclase (GGDEF)-like protein
MNQPLPNHTNIWVVALNFYWVFVLVASLYFVGGHLLWGSSMAAVVSSGLFALTGLLAFGLYRLPLFQRMRRGLGLVVAHLLVGQVILAWQFQHLPMRDFTLTTDPDVKSLLIFLISVLNILMASIYGGLLGAALSLLMHYIFIFQPGGGFSIMWIYPVLLAVVGSLVNWVFERMNTMRRQLEALALRDPLTGMYNRLKLEPEFYQYQEMAKQYNQPLLLVVWDMDDLKRINDEQGHAAGDAYILQFTAALQKQIRQPNSLRQGDVAFRVGGDEFISLHLGLESGEKLMERVQAEFDWVSGGWARCEDLNLDRSLSLADLMMYTNKENRKQRRPNRPLPQMQV